MAYIRRRGCKCKKETDESGKVKKKKCNCGAKWSFTIDVGIDPKTGERKQKTKSGYATRDLAEQAAATLLLEYKGGEYISEDNTLFKDFALDWVERFKKTGKKISTVVVREYGAKLLIDEFPFMKLRDISNYHYQDALYRFKERGFSKSTIISIHVAGKMIFKSAIERKKIKQSPADNATIPEFIKTVEEIENEEEVEKYLEKEELMKFLKHCKAKGKPSDYTIFLLLSYTGIRVGELCALKWRDLDLENGILSVRRTYFNKKRISDYTVLTPKTKKSKRDIEIDAQVIAELKKHQAAQRQLMMRYRPTYDDNDFVFVKGSERSGKNAGKPHAPWYVRGRMKRLLKQCRIVQNLTPHSLRHTHTSLLAEAGVELPEIMERLGHEDDKTTKQIYLHITKSRKKQAVTKFAALMNSLE